MKKLLAIVSAAALCIGFMSCAKNVPEPLTPEQEAEKAAKERQQVIDYLDELFALTPNDYYAITEDGNLGINFWGIQGYNGNDEDITFGISLRFPDNENPGEFLYPTLFVGTYLEDFTLKNNKLECMIEYEEGKYEKAYVSFTNNRIKFEMHDILYNAFIKATEANTNIGLESLPGKIITFISKYN